MSTQFETTITTLSHDGRGIAHINGKTTFIKNALPGETIRATYTNKRSQFDEAILNEVLIPSADRAMPPCAHFGVCGGCSLQHMSPALQIQYKQEVLLNHLQHFGNIQPETLLSPLTAATTQYRRKARLGVRYVRKKQRLLVGFRENNGRYLAELSSCAVLDSRIGTKLTLLADCIMQLKHYDHIPQIEVAAGDSQIALIFRHLQPLDPEEITLLMQFGDQHHFDIYLQPAGMESIHKIWPQAQPERLTYAIPQENLQLAFHPAHFTQVNAQINLQMIQQALHLLDLQPEDTVLDLFCGLGNFTLPMAKHSQHVIGVEGDAAMVKQGYENATLNQLSNVEFYSTNLMEDFTHQPWFKKTYTKILLDPPRAGAEAIVNQIAKLKAKRIVYISCNTATLARDAGILVKQGYRLKTAGIMDMFPHTAHVESIALFERD